MKISRDNWLLWVLWSLQVLCVAVVLVSGDGPIGRTLGNVALVSAAITFPFTLAVSLLTLFRGTRIE